MSSVPARLYVHGYSPREAERLSDQANTLNGLLHEGNRADRIPAGGQPRN